MQTINRCNIFTNVKLLLYFYSILIKIVILLYGIQVILLVGHLDIYIMLNIEIKNAVI